MDPSGSCAPLSRNAPEPSPPSCQLKRVKPDLLKPTRAGAGLLLHPQLSSAPKGKETPLEMDEKMILQGFSPRNQCKVGGAAGGNEGRFGADTTGISRDEGGQKELGGNAGPGLGTRDFLGH